ncbi:MAG: roadblock/LC7 domain-containing protein, partial [Anaerolineae bacterium]
MPGWLDQVEAKLIRLRMEANVDWVVLAQSDGSVAAASPGADRIDVAALAALAAGSLSASGELMRLAGEARPPRHMVHRGESRSLVVSAVGRDRFLLIGFSPQRRAGLIRALAERAA